MFPKYISFPPIIYLTKILKNSDDKTKQKRLQDFVQFININLLINKYIFIN